jgi:hypothetical protein
MRRNVRRSTSRNVRLWRIQFRRKSATLSMKKSVTPSTKGNAKQSTNRNAKPSMKNSVRRFKIR